MMQRAFTLKSELIGDLRTTEVKYGWYNPTLDVVTATVICNLQVAYFSESPTT